MRFRILWNELESSFWFRPLLWVLGFCALALTLITVDEQLIRAGIRFEPPYLVIQEADGARVMLAIIAAALLTVATLVFSIIMVAVVQTANAYSPRILDRYLADSINQHALGILLGTFLYTLFVLRVVNPGEPDYIPIISVAIALIFIFFTTVAFIYFIGHVAHSIEVSAIIRRIQKETVESMENLFPEGMGQAWTGSIPPPPEGTPKEIVAWRDGYVEVILPDELLGAVTRADAVLRLEVEIGEYVLRGTPLATVWPAQQGEALREVIHHTVVLGETRTLVQDPHYGAQQLSDMALRALSPAINDPTTAVECVRGLASLCVEMAYRTPVSPYRCDANGTLRVVARGPTFASMASVAFDQIRHYGTEDPFVTLQLLKVFRQIGYAARYPADRATLWEQVAHVMWAAAKDISAPSARATVNEALCDTAQALGHDPEPLLLEVSDDLRPVHS